jgi:hypothetical protein
VFGLSFCLKTPGFHLGKISSPLKFSSEWEVGSGELPEEAIQDYFYIKGGTQCYAFVSADGKYVLKFFKMQHLRPKSRLLYAIPYLSNYAYEKIEKRELRQKAIFTSYKMAFEELREETGLLYLHLNKTRHLQKGVTLTDKEGKRHPVNLDDVEFVLQEKAELLSSRFRTNRSYEEKKKLCDAILGLVERRCEKGFSDRDESISNNYGFIDGRAVQIDVGRIQRDETMKSAQNMQRELQRVHAKLQDNL